MIRVGTNTRLSPDVPKAAAAGTAVALSKVPAAVNPLDQVELSRLASIQPEDRLKKIEALKATVSEPGYLPPSLPVIGKIVAGALSRPE
jgi:hypothetical protein